MEITGFAVAATDRAIDAPVCELYGLAAGEIALVEGADQAAEAVTLQKEYT